MSYANPPPPQELDFFVSCVSARFHEDFPDFYTVFDNVITHNIHSTGDRLLRALKPLKLSSSIRFPDFYPKDDYVYLVIIDYDVLDINGLQLLSILKRKWEYIYVAVVQSVYDEPIAKQCETLGAIDYLSRPFTSNQLHKLRERVMKAERSKRNAYERLGINELNPDSLIDTNPENFVYSISIASQWINKGFPDFSSLFQHVIKRNIHSSGADLLYEMKMLPRPTQSACLYPHGNNVFLVIIDYDLPDISGIQLLRMLKEKWEYINVVIVQSVHNEEVRRACKEAGALKYISAPVTPYKLSNLRLRVALAEKDMRISYEEAEFKRRKWITFMKQYPRQFKRGGRAIAERRLTRTPTVRPHRRGVGHDI